MDKHTHIKLGLVGEQGVGKTHIINRYLANRLPDNPASTIAVEFATTIFQLKDGTRFKIEVWDTAGHEKYKQIVCVHLKNADGIVIVYDLLNRKSFEQVKRWIERIKVECEDRPILMMFGNKLDVVQKNPMSRKVDEKQGQELAQENGLIFYETSVKKPQVIQNAIEEMIEAIVLRKSQRNLSDLKKIQKEEDTPVCSGCSLY